MIEATIEVARADWVRTLNEFNAIHEGALVTVEVLAPSVGAQSEVLDLPLVGITFEPGPSAMSIAVGRGDDLIVHVIQEPTRLWIARANGRVDAAMEVESADGARTIVRFTHTAPPEIVGTGARRHAARRSR